MDSLSVPLIPGNSNDQSVTSLPYADQIHIERLCLHSDYWGADGLNIRMNDHVTHEQYGSGVVTSYCGESTVLQYVLVEFDSGKSYSVQPNTLSHT